MVQGVQKKMCKKTPDQQAWPGQGEWSTWHSSTASFMRTVMNSSPISSGRPAERITRTTCRDGLANTGWMPRDLCSKIHSCAGGNSQAVS